MIGNIDKKYDLYFVLLNNENKFTILAFSWQLKRLNIFTYYTMHKILCVFYLLIYCHLLNIW